MIYNQVVTVIRPVITTDAMNNPKYLWEESEGATHTVYRNVCVYPVQNREHEEINTGKRVRTVSGWRIHTMPWKDMDVQAVDRIIWNGRVLEVQGDPTRYHSPSIPSHVHHIEVDIDLKEG